MPVRSGLCDMEPHWPMLVKGVPFHTVEGDPQQSTSGRSVLPCYMHARLDWKVMPLLSLYPTLIRSTCVVILHKPAAVVVRKASLFHCCTIQNKCSKCYSSGKCTRGHDICSFLQDFACTAATLSSSCCVSSCLLWTRLDHLMGKVQELKQVVCASSVHL